jgi:hypothetical protein
VTALLALILVTATEAPLAVPTLRTDELCSFVRLKRPVDPTVAIRRRSRLART